MRLGSPVLMCCVLATAVTPLLAQQTGAIRGTVTDSQAASGCPGSRSRRARTSCPGRGATVTGRRRRVPAAGVAARRVHGDLHAVRHADGDAQGQRAARAGRPSPTRARRSRAVERDGDRHRRGHRWSTSVGHHHQRLSERPDHGSAGGRRNTAICMQADPRRAVHAGHRCAARAPAAAARTTSTSSTASTSRCRSSARSRPSRRRTTSRRSRSSRAARGRSTSTARAASRSTRSASRARAATPARLSYQFQNQRHGRRSSNNGSISRYEQDRDWLDRERRRADRQGPGCSSTASYYRPAATRDNRANALRRRCPSTTSTRNEGFGKLTFTPTASTAGQRQLPRLAARRTRATLFAANAGAHDRHRQRVVAEDRHRGRLVGHQLDAATSTFKYTHFANADARAARTTSPTRRSSTDDRHAPRHRQSRQAGPAHGAHTDRTERRVQRVHPAAHRPVRLRRRTACTTGGGTVGFATLQTRPGQLLPRRRPDRLQHDVSAASVRARPPRRLPAVRWTRRI